MKPIDMNRVNMGMIHTSIQDTGKAKQVSNPEPIIVRRATTPTLIHLLSLVKQAPELTESQTRLQEMKSAIQSGTYQIDMDSLVDNIWVAEHEL